MDQSVPAGAAMLLDFIYRTETSKAPPQYYEVIYGNRQSALSKPLTSMTLGEVIDAQKTWSTKAWAKKFGSTKASSAAGAAQFMRATLIDLSKELGLRGDQRFDPDFQDRLAYHLLKRRGYEAFMAGQISRTEFGKRLAQEWASFPVLADTDGAYRKVRRGQSYAGDGLSKAGGTSGGRNHPCPDESRRSRNRRAQAHSRSNPQRETPQRAPVAVSGGKAGIIVLALIVAAIIAAVFFLN